MARLGPGTARSWHGCPSLAVPRDTAWGPCPWLGGFKILQPKPVWGSMALSPVFGKSTSTPPFSWTEFFSKLGEVLVFSAGFYQGRLRLDPSRNFPMERELRAWRGGLDTHPWSVPGAPGRVPRALGRGQAGIRHRLHSMLWEGFSSSGLLGFSGFSTCS